MTTFYTPKPIEYENKLPIKIWQLYKTLSWNSTYKIDMDTFEERDKAVDVLKKMLDGGAITFSHFTEDYTQFVVFRNDFTDEMMELRIKEKNRDGEEE